MGIGSLKEKFIKGGIRICLKARKEYLACC